MLSLNIRKSISFYNEQCDKVQSGGEYVYNPKLFSWDRQQRSDVLKNKKYHYNPSCIRVAEYRPFCSSNLYLSRNMNNCVYQIPQLFPSTSHENFVICVESPGGKKDFSAFITKNIPDLHILETSQCFPLFYYRQKEKMQQASLLDERDDQYVREDGITTWILKNIRARFQNARTITKEEIFYYVYGILHSQDYRTKFADDLKKSLPRIPIVDDVETFMDFAIAGRKLAELHLNYESVPAYPSVVVNRSLEKPNYRVEKMRFADKTTKDCIIYNSNIRIENIPDEAYEYVVNGKSAIEWIIDQYKIDTDKKSGIVNDPNDWAIEHNKPSYILDLLLSVINVSMQTMEIVKNLPKLTFEDESSANSGK